MRMSSTTPVLIVLKQRSELKSLRDTFLQRMTSLTKLLECLT